MRLDLNGTYINFIHNFMVISSSDDGQVPPTIYVSVWLVPRIDISDGKDFLKDIECTSQRHDLSQ